MKAVVLKDFDQPLSVAEVPTPEPGAGEVRVRIEAASVNGFDLSVAASRLKGAVEHRFPVVLGKDFAGTVDAVGPDVQGYDVGDRVFGVVTKDFMGDGSFAEYVSVPVAVGLAKLPETVSFTEGAALGLAGTAAVDAVDGADIREGDSVLVIGATGGVGQQALQLAVRAGAKVTASAHSPAEAELVTELGAVNTVDYTENLPGQVRSLYPDGVDVVLHFAGDPTPLVPLVKSGGTFVSTMLRSAEDIPTTDFRVVSVYANPSPATLARVAGNQAEQATKVTVQRTYALEKTPDAFADFATGTLGKLVITTR